jgi:heat shock protein HslJ
MSDRHAITLDPSRLGARPVPLRRRRRRWSVAAAVCAAALLIVGFRLAQTGFTGLGNPSLPRALVNTTWQVTSIVRSGRTVAYPPPTGPAILTLHGHSFRIIGDCNDESGPLSISGNRLTFRVSEGSLVACGDEEAYVVLERLVNGPAHFTAGAGTLELRSHDTSFQLTPAPASR